MRRLLFIFIVLILTAGLNEIYAQSGGRKREHRNQRRGGSLFKRTKSAGHADAFAKGGGGGKRKGKRMNNSPWVYHKTYSDKKQTRENRNLFSRFRTKGKRMRDGMIARQNTERNSKRVRGNKVFHKRKY